MADTKFKVVTDIYYKTDEQDNIVNFQNKVEMTALNNGNESGSLIILMHGASVEELSKMEIEFDIREKDIDPINYFLENQKNEFIVVDEDGTPIVLEFFTKGIVDKSFVEAEVFGELDLSNAEVLSDNMFHYHDEYII